MYEYWLLSHTHTHTHKYKQIYQINKISPNSYLYSNGNSHAIGVTCTCRCVTNIRNDLFKILIWKRFSVKHHCQLRADFRFAPSQWETALLGNDGFHWLGASLESALQLCVYRQGYAWNTSFEMYGHVIGDEPSGSWFSKACFKKQTRWLYSLQEMGCRLLKYLYFRLVKHTFNGNWQLESIILTDIDGEFWFISFEVLQWGIILVFYYYFHKQMSYFQVSYTVSKKLKRAAYREIYLPPSDMPGIATVIHLSQGLQVYTEQPYWALKW